MASLLSSSEYYSSSNNNHKSCLSCFGFGEDDDMNNHPQAFSMSSAHHHHQSSGMMIKDSNSSNNSNSVEFLKQTEDDLAAELGKLTVHERAQALDDVHCVGEELQETPEMIEQSFLQFDQLVNQLQNPVYNLAVSQNRGYVEDPAFRLRFLRCNLHDVPKSVSQMMEFLKHKAAYFGEDKLAREITLEDLSEEDMNLMLSGLYHIQDERDRTGRVIICVMTEMLGRCKIENLIHVAYYMWNNIMIPIPEVQTKGVVGLYYDVTRPGEKLVTPGLNFMVTLFQVLMTFPLRYSALHIYPKVGGGDLIRYSMNLFPKYARVRCRIHYGTDMEVQYSLRGHGLPIESCPVDVDGNIRQDILNTWFYKHKASRAAATLYASSIPTTMLPGDQDDTAATAGARAVSVLDSQDMDDLDLMSDDLDEQFEEFESSSNFFLGQGNDNNNNNNDNYNEDGGGGSSGENNNNAAAAAAAAVGIANGVAPAVVHNGSIVPTDNDVLLGRGRGVQHHSGNVRFRKMLEAYRLDYDKTPRKKRRQYSAAVTHFLLGNGIRFLQKTDDGDWMISSFEEADRKVGQLFRTLRKKV